MNTKKLKPGLVTSYNMHPGNREELSLFQCFINLSLTYLLRHLPTYLQPRDPQGAIGAGSFMGQIPFLSSTEQCQITPGKSSQEICPYMKHTWSSKYIISAICDWWNLGCETSKTASLLQVSSAARSLQFRHDVLPTTMKFPCRRPCESQ